MNNIHISKISLLILLLSLLSPNLLHPIKVSSESKPDLIIMDADIVTMEPNDSDYKFIEVTGDIITGLHETLSPDILSDNTILKISLDGRTILPGFIDGHSHWIGDKDRLGYSNDESIQHILSSGWTSLSEMFVSQERLDELIRLDSEDRLKVRVNAYLPINYQEQRFGDWYKAYSPHQQVSDKVRIAGVKLFMDNGANIGYGGSNIWFNSTELDPIVKEAHDLGYQIAIHSMTDNATDIALDALEAAQEDNSDGHYRHRIEHARLLRDDQITRLADMNVIVCAQYFWYTGDSKRWFNDTISSEDLEAVSHLIARWRDVIDAGVFFIGSTDTPWGVPDGIGPVINAISRATTRIGDLDYEPYDWMLNQRITIEEALRSLTIDAAYASFEEDIKGSIKVGKLADFVILSDNPLDTALEDLLNLSVDMSIIGGKAMYCSYELENTCQEYDAISTDEDDRSSENIEFPYLINYAISSLILLVVLNIRISRNRTK